MHSGPKLFLALLWHQHQPMYLDWLEFAPEGRFTLPWVRLHCIRELSC
jgi:alpha-amylase/alpha-mannosidase (GH57 family)